MVGQFAKTQLKVKKLAMHWEEANVIGHIARVPTLLFTEVMNDVLCDYLVFKGSCAGVQQLSQLLEARH